MPRLRVIACAKCQKNSYLQPDAMSTYCRIDGCREDDGDFLDDLGVSYVSLGDLPQEDRDYYARQIPKMEEEMLQLAADLENWRDAADYKDNAGRIARCIRFLPDMIEELRRKRRSSFPI